MLLLNELEFVIAALYPHDLILLRLSYFFRY